MTDTHTQREGRRERGKRGEEGTETKCNFFSRKKNLFYFLVDKILVSHSEILHLVGDKDNKPWEYSIW